MTGAASRRKGASFELLVAHYLKTEWPDSQRQLERRSDVGDIAGGPFGVLIECKNHHDINLAAFMNQTVTAAENIDADHPLLIVKRRGRTVRDAYAVMPLSHMAELLKEARR